QQTGRPLRSFELFCPCRAGRLLSCVVGPPGRFRSRVRTVAKSKAPSQLADDPYYRVIRKMNTFVCEGCYNEELRVHPELGDDWTADGYPAMAQLEKEKGWLMLPVEGERESWFFREFQVLGPKCAAKRVNGG